MYGFEESRNNYKILGMHTDLNWEIPDENQHYLGCSFIWNNKMILTGGRGGPGGYKVYRHVSEVYDCGIKALEITLPIEFESFVE